MRIIGLFSNARENYHGAVLLATHHPPFSYAPPPNMGSGGNHSSSSAMLREIDKICDREGVYPHAFLAARHNVNPLVRGKKGQGPHEPHMGSNVDYLEFQPTLKTKELLLEKYDDINYGYLRIHVDKEQIKIGFHQVGAGTLAQSRFDMVTVDLAKHEMVAN